MASADCPHLARSRLPAVLYRARATGHNLAVSPSSSRSMLPSPIPHSHAAAAGCRKSPRNLTDACVHDRGGLKSASPRCRLKSAYPGGLHAARAMDCPADPRYSVTAIGSS